MKFPWRKAAAAAMSVVRRPTVTFRKCIVCGGKIEMIDAASWRCTKCGFVYKAGAGDGLPELPKYDKLEGEI